MFLSRSNSRLKINLGSGDDIIRGGGARVKTGPGEDMLMGGGSMRVLDFDTGKDSIKAYRDNSDYYWNYVDGASSIVIRRVFLTPYKQEEDIELQSITEIDEININAPVELDTSIISNNI